MDSRPLILKSVVASLLSQAVSELRTLLEAGDTLAIIERFYAPDVCVFENHVMARAGREACLKHEQKQLAKQPEPLRVVVKATAINDTDGVVFMEYTLRFTGPEDRPMRLDQVSVQRWHRGLISEERFYYEGVIDEGDDE